MAVSPTNDLKHTPLHSLHSELDARMVPFAGYAMPVQYAGVKAEHLHTRQAAGLFDVSHMGQVLIQGDGAAEKLEALLPVDLVGLPALKQSYALLTNENGGIKDDLMICRWDDNTFFCVVNAACKDADLGWLHQELPDLQIEHLEDKALIALQGPASAAVLAGVLPEINSLSFMQGCHVTLEGAPAFVTRSGYTGEDGFEISLPATHAELFARQLLENAEVQAIGLGARDTLRLEAGLCLYGHDLDESITPVTANLSWSISKARRPGGKRPGGFYGAERILNELSQGTSEKRVGLKGDSRAPVREGAQLIDEKANPIGRVTSGGFGPSLNAPIAMGYIQSNLAEPGTRIAAVVRGKPIPLSVTPLPFIPNNFVR